MLLCLNALNAGTQINAARVTDPSMSSLPHTCYTQIPVTWILITGTCTSWWYSLYQSQSSASLCLVSSSEPSDSTHLWILPDDTYLTSRVFRWTSLFVSFVLSLISLRVHQFPGKDIELLICEVFIVSSLFSSHSSTDLHLAHSAYK